MQVFDASSMIHAWDNYPERQFPGLWAWLGIQVNEGQLVMPRVAFDEVDNKIPDCGLWLEKYSIQRLEITNAILQKALSIKNLLGIKGDIYSPKGVGENDILIIATACDYGIELVSNEGRQKIPPTILANMKIPAVCLLKEVAVPCINFIEFIKRSNEIFH